MKKFIEDNGWFFGVIVGLGIAFIIMGTIRQFHLLSPPEHIYTCEEHWHFDREWTRGAFPNSAYKRDGMFAKVIWCSRDWVPVFHPIAVLGNGSTSPNQGQFGQCAISNNLISCEAMVIVNEWQNNEDVREHCEVKCETEKKAKTLQR